MRLKELESALGSVNGFERPKIALEPYETPSHISGARRRVRVMMAMVSVCCDVDVCDSER